MDELNDIHIPLHFIEGCLKHRACHEGNYSVDGSVFEKEFLQNLSKTYARSQEELLALWRRMGIETAVSGDKVIFSSPPILLTTGKFMWRQALL